MTNRQFYTYKFESSRLKAFGYNIEIGFDDAIEFSEVVALADSQVLRSIRGIRKHTIDYEKIDMMHIIKNKAKRKALKYTSRPHDNVKEYVKKKVDAGEKFGEKVQLLLKEYLEPKNPYINMSKFYQDKINRTMFIPDYVTVVMSHPSHYKYIYKNGVIINGKTYKRFSCSAGQARNSTVVLCCDEIIDELREIIENGRDKSKEVAPNKFNAYFGLATSSTKVVSEPKFIVVKDFENTTSFIANYVTETDWDKDDEIDQRLIKDMPMNRTDGMGLISPRQSEKWANELGLDYTPEQWCIRQSFLKGMLCTFDIHRFCEEKNGGNYIVDTIYKDENGKYIKADLRDCEVIITESQLKLWGSYPNVETYVENYRKNNLQWGVSQYTAKKPKDVLKMNYQFIQTLNLSENDIKKMCSQFVDWIQGVSYNNFGYMLLFLLGVNNTDEKIKRFLKSSDNYWVKSLVVNPSLKNDRYIRTKIRDLIKTKIQNGYMGDIFIDGNFQVLISDPYGFMQHVCGQEVTGLLKKNEFYCNYWNEKGVTLVDGMRSPLTYRSEHVLLNLVKNEETEKWFKYCKQGVILNYHGHEVVNFGGADFDFDILATTSNEQVIKGVYTDELPVIYDPPESKKVIFTEEDLYHADTFSFGSIIGSITNKSSNGYALLSVIEELHGKDSREYEITLSRLKQCCKAQSAQIDKAKIGRQVKGIPDIWVNKQVVPEDERGLYKEEDLEDIEMYNNILLNKYPYFFKYRYNHCKKDYNRYVDENEVTCKQRFKMSLSKLLKLDRHTLEQSEFIDNYYKHMPLVMSKSTMNLLCKHIESVDFNISDKIKSDDFVNGAEIYKNNRYTYTDQEKEEITKVLEKHAKNKRHERASFSLEYDDKFNHDAVAEFNIYSESLEEELMKVCSDMNVVVNCLVDYFYYEKKGKNKDILWNSFGRHIFNNVKNNSSNRILFPFEKEGGSIKYMGNEYEMMEVDIN